MDTSSIIVLISIVALLLFLVMVIDSVDKKIIENRQRDWENQQILKFQEEQKQKQIVLDKILENKKKKEEEIELTLKYNIELKKHNFIDAVELGRLLGFTEDYIQTDILVHSKIF
jgi:hypothetical protein